MRDIEPEEYALQARVQRAFEEVADLFNFSMMEPAPLEHLSVLRAKSGAEVDKEIYAFKDKGGRDVGLRFDLTVGMTRYVCARRDLKPPVKLASLAGAWRYDEPQHARYRWFRQWDLEIFGPPSLEADAEVVEASYQLFKRLGLKNFSVQIGDRGTVQHFVSKVLGIKENERAVEMMRALDKVQKRALPDLRREYAEKGFRPKDIDRLFEFGSIRGPPGKVLSRLGESEVESPALEAIADIMRGRGVEVEFNLGVVRGIDYYTGVVFEVVDSTHPDLGSLAGGGRYDLLPGTFGRPDLSATGAAGGMERIALALSRDAVRPSPLVYVALVGKEARDESYRVLRELRSNGVPAESALHERSLAKQLEDASRRGASWVIILGKKEVQAGKVTLRDMTSRTEELISFASALGRLKRA
ncbi:MAG: histidine--tRNA ligase [Nitrososphaerales archaeon]